MKNKHIIDTNVLIVANGDNEQISESDISACENFLISAKSNSLIYVDSEFLIFEEYYKHMNRSGQPGLADAYTKWLFDNQCNEEYCRIVTITKNGEHQFSEYPKDDDLSDFDLSDRKFVAVAIASNKEPVIVNGTDSDWFHHLDAFNNHGIKILFLCDDEKESWNN